MEAYWVEPEAMVGEWLFQKTSSSSSKLICSGS